jgi:hypothetical protein
MSSRVSAVLVQNSASAALLLFALLSISNPLAAAQGQSRKRGSDVKKQLPSLQTNLRDGMDEIARIYETPMLVVLQADHAELRLPASKMTLREVLDSAVSQNPGYRWEETANSVIYFYQTAVQMDPLNFLNWKLKWFPIFGSVLQVERLLRSSIQNVRYHATHEGGANSVAGADEEWEKHSLPRVEMANVTPTEVILKTMDMDGEFYSIIQFPGPGALKDSDLNDAFASWRWVSFDKAPKS